MDTVLGKEGRMAMIAVLALAIGTLIPVERLAALKGLAAPAPWLLTLMVTLLLMTLIIVDVFVVGRGVRRRARPSTNA